MQYRYGICCHSGGSLCRFLLCHLLRATVIHVSPPPPRIINVSFPAHQPVFQVHEVFATISGAAFVSSPAVTISSVA